MHTAALFRGNPGSVEIVDFLNTLSGAYFGADELPATRLIFPGSKLVGSLQ